MSNIDRNITGISNNGFDSQSSKPLEQNINNYFVTQTIESIKSILADEGFEEEEIIRSVLNSSKAHMRSAYKGMWSYMLHVSSSHITTRETHQEEVANEARFCAKELGLNADLAEFIANHHDDGHVSNGHKGEQILSSITEKDGMGYITHNALGVVQLYFVEKMPQRIIEEIKRRRPNITQERLNKINKNLWKIFDGILSHNGEGVQGVIKPNRNKVARDFYEDTVNSFVYKEYDKYIEPATMEGCLIRFLDIICYVSSDFTDGCKEGLIDGPDETYMEFLNKLEINISGIPIHELKDYIARELKVKFINKLIEYSKGKNEIGMPPETFKLLMDMREWNYHHISSRGLSGEDNEIIPKATEKLIDKYADILMETSVTNETFELNLSKAFSKEKEKKRLGYEEKRGVKKLIHYAENMDPKLRTFIKKVVREATRVSISEEVDIAYKLIKGERLKQSESKKLAIPEIKNRLDRFYSELDFLLKNQDHTDTQDDIEKIKSDYKNSMMKEIETSTQNSIEEHNQRKLKHGENFKNVLRLKTIEERIAKEVAVFFVGGADDEYLIGLCEELEVITPEEIQILSKGYRELPEIDDATREENIGLTIERQRRELREKHGEVTGEGRE